ncbi:hypothetical protein QR78_21100 [Methylobacterium indicum]|uniref:DUF898 domain-containing protein n=2 Tax=Methylobacterium indicum TaxID=1775910 RepID=A0ABR5HI01_9HYPH|nr:hypothetical protein QR78_21100 [Methylobacterium indicum]KMO26196.1 hypothetical protein QR79_03755 [Methylobacterium indicum]
MSIAMTEARPGSAPQGVSVTFDTTFRGLTRLALKGILLSLVTFGIYRFWYVTDLRRFFWSRTTIDGSPAVYTGTGKELFLGFLVALVLLVPIYLGLFAISLAIPALAPASVAISFVSLFVLGQYALYRGRRYRAMRTLWRGIRLGQDGSALGYAARAAGWWLLVYLSFGLAFPFMRASQERYRINHTLVGTSRLTSEARGRSVLGPWLLLYLVGLGIPIGFGVALLVASDFSLPSDLMVPKPGGKAGETILNPAYAGTAIGRLANALFFAALICLPAAFMLIPYYRAREARAFAGAVRLGGVRLASTLRARAFYGPYIRYVLSLVGLMLVLGLGGVLLALAARQVNFSFIHWFIVLGYVIMAPLGAVLYVRLVRARLWAAVATSLTVLNSEDLSAILASARGAGSGLQEGLADALDVGGALQIGL